MKTNHGFTLFEVLIVIVILGLVSSISIPALGRVYENIRKDAVLNDVMAIERAARNYCFRNRDACEAGSVLSHNEIASIANTVLEGYTIEVTISNVSGLYYVTYYHEEERSFPYDENGSFMGLISPMNVSRDHVNFPSDTLDSIVGFGSSKVDTCLNETINPWEPKDYTEGHCVEYNGATFYNWHYANSNHIPGTDQVWTEITPYWREQNYYYGGDRIIHQGDVYEAHNVANEGQEPGTHEVWQKITDQWEPNNTYLVGEIVEHDGQEWRARYWTRGDEPGESTVWDPYDETIDDKPLGDPYNPNVGYNGGDQVWHNDLLFEARWFTRGNEPGTHEVWNAITDEWHMYNNYASGDEVNHNNQRWKARHSTVGDEPGTHVVWDVINTSQWHMYNNYTGGAEVTHNNQTWEARWTTQGDEPGVHNVWQLVD